MDGVVWLADSFARSFGGGGLPARQCHTTSVVRPEASAVAGLHLTRQAFCVGAKLWWW